MNDPIPFTIFTHAVWCVRKRLIVFCLHSSFPQTWQKGKDFKDSKYCYRLRYSHWGTKCIWNPSSHELGLQDPLQGSSQKWQGNLKFPTSSITRKVVILQCWFFIVTNFFFFCLQKSILDALLYILNCDPKCVTNDIFKENMNRYPIKKLIP